MIILIIRIALTALAVGFLAWLGYIIYLGLKNFFNLTNSNAKSINADEDKSKE